MCMCVGMCVCMGVCGVSGDLHAASTKAVMHYQYNTICRGGKSLMEALNTRFPNVNLEKYVCFLSLRAYARVGKKFITQMVYVHSKLLIVDDEVRITLIILITL